MTADHWVPEIYVFCCCTINQVCFKYFLFRYMLLTILEVWCFSLAVSNGNGLFLLTLPSCMSTYHAGLKCLELLCQKVFRHNRENQGHSQITVLISWDPELEVICTKTSINHSLKSVKGQLSDNRNRCFNPICYSFYKKAIHSQKSQTIK